MSTRRARSRREFADTRFDVNDGDGISEKIEYRLVQVPHERVLCKGYFQLIAYLVCIRLVHGRQAGFPAGCGRVAKKIVFSIEKACIVDSVVDCLGVLGRQTFDSPEAFRVKLARCTADQLSWYIYGQELSVAVLDVVVKRQCVIYPCDEDCGGGGGEYGIPVS